MKNLIFILTLTLGITSCSLDVSNCDPELFHSDWTTSRTILVEYDSVFQRNNYRIVEGKNNLFEYNHSDAQCDDVLDDEWSEALTFEVDGKINEFEYRDEEILQTNCFYRQYGAWAGDFQQEISKGMMKGKKIATTEWEIEVSLTVPSSTVDGQFIIIEFNELFRK